MYVCMYVCMFVCLFVCLFVGCILFHSILEFVLAKPKIFEGGETSGSGGLSFVSSSDGYGTTCFREKVDKRLSQHVSGTIYISSFNYFLTLLCLRVFLFQLILDLVSKNLGEMTRREKAKLETEAHEKKTGGEGEDKDSQEDGEVDTSTEADKSNAENEEDEAIIRRFQQRLRRTPTPTRRMYRTTSRGQLN